MTLNPSLDLSSSVEAIEPWRKLRCDDLRTDPGGGGVNVSRVVRELGGATLAVVALGGHVGSAYAAALRRGEVPHHRVSVRGCTRQNFAVSERATGKQFRFVHRGEPMSPGEWRRCADATIEAGRDASCVVISSSLPPGLPDDAFATLVERLALHGMPVIVDTSGPALALALRAPTHLVKPSVNELSTIVGRSLATVHDCEEAARELLAHGQCLTIAVSLGADGALIVPREAPSFRVHAPAVTALSSIGAGDSMVAGMAFATARGASLEAAAVLGVAAGTAAVLAAGTGLCRREDVDRLANQVTVAR